VGTACFWDLTAIHRPSGHTSLEISYGIAAKAEAQLGGFAREALDPKVVSRFGLTFAHDGQSFITTDPDGFVGVWDTKSVQRTEALSGLGSNNWGVALSPDDHWLAAGNASGKIHKIHIWDWRQRVLVKSLEVPFEWFGLLRFSRSGRFLWALVEFNDWTTRFRVWRTGDWQEMPLGAVDAGAFFWADSSPDDRFLATGHISGAVKLWNFPSGRPEISFTNQAAAVCAIFFSPDGRRLVSASWDGTVRLRDLFAHREVAPLRGHTGAVGGAALSADGRRLATGGSDARDAVKLWDLATHRELLSLQAEGELLFAPVAYSPDGSTLMAVSFAGIAHLWRAPSWAEIEAAEKGLVTP
jgi:WD40 repeat protein